MSKLYDTITDENGFMIKLRMKGIFDNNDYLNIKNALLDIIPEWKMTGNVSLEDFTAVLELIRFLASGNRAWNNDVAFKAEDAEIELMDIIAEISL